MRYIYTMQIVMENPNHLNEPNEAFLEVNPVVPKPNQVANIHDPNKMVDIPDDIDLVDYDEEDHEEDPKEEPEEDVDIELKDDAELIFPYELEGDKTPPPGDVSSDSVSFESESEDKEPYAIRDFSRDLFKVGESSSARDSSNVHGLAPCALRRNLEASRARSRVMEAELGICQTEIALLKSKDKISEKERELLNHDLENVERDLGNVLERMFYFDMVRIGAVPKPPSNDEDTKRLRKKLKNSTSDGTEGPSEPYGPPTMFEAHMCEIIRDQVTTSMAEFVANMKRETGSARAGGAKVDGAGADGTGADGAGAGGAEVGGVGPAVPKITGDCKEKDQVKFETATLQGRALTSWNGRIASMGINAANGTPWTEVRKWMTEEFCPRRVLQRLEQDMYNLKLKGTDIDGHCGLHNGLPSFADI
nr:putative reverse transcriptase domain-containing protein [Tanacetum cinerariifolium]